MAAIVVCSYVKAAVLLPRIKVERPWPALVLVALALRLGTGTPPQLLACASHAVRQAEVHGKSACRLRGRGLVHRDCVCSNPCFCCFFDSSMFFCFLQDVCVFRLPCSALANTGGGGGGGAGSGAGAGGSGIVVVKCYNC